MFAKILVPVDGSVHANSAVKYAGRLAEKFDSSITLLHVMTHSGTGRIPEELKQFARSENLEANEANVMQVVADSILQGAKDAAQTAGASDVETVTDFGEPARKIIDHCNARQIDTIVMGRRGLGGLGELFLGSVSHKVTQQTQCACLTVGGDLA